MFAPANDPLELEVLVLPDSTLIQTAAVLEPLRAANRILGRALYSWVLTTPDGHPARTTSGIEIPAARAFDAAASRAPLLIIASYNKDSHITRDLLRKVSNARRYRPSIGGVETGVLLMAQAGLLNGYAATAHWEDIDDFAARFPEVNVVHDRFCIDRNRFTSGGASPTLDMMIELIRQRQGVGLALEVSKAFIYDPGPRISPPRRIALARMIPADKRVARAVALMEAHISAPLSIDDIARRTGTSARHLQSLFVQLLEMRPKAYYQALRLNLARRQIIETAAQISQIANNAGFSSLAVFSTAYCGYFGESPSATRKVRASAH